MIPQHSLECINFVREALAIAQSDHELSPQAIADAAGVCRVVLELAVDQFGHDGKDILIAWGITSSEDVGTIVYRLIEAGVVIRHPCDSPADFEGLFDLRSPPESWKLTW